VEIETPFRKSHLSWCRCAYCDAASYQAVSRTIFSIKPRRMLIEYKCARCGRMSVLRHPLLTMIGLPFAVGLCAFLVLYHVLIVASSWLSLSTLLLASLIIGMAAATEIVLLRLAKRFQRSDRSTDS
jgi:hypothetical protein